MLSVRLRYRLDTEKRPRKRLARAGHKQSYDVQNLRGISEGEMFNVVTAGKKTHQKSWNRMVNKPTFVGKGFRRQNPKAEMIIRPMGLRQKFAHGSHPTLGITMKASILFVKKNRQDAIYTRLGLLTSGTVVEVNVSDRGLTIQRTRTRILLV
ncbi:putative ribosome biogenesis protein nsa-2 [Colletotrichum sp. SAR11_240]|nr:putative ribosome biogenesis protein nsa-2 [Colletotrichum sp. SAR11_240]